MSWFKVSNQHHTHQGKRLSRALGGLGGQGLSGGASSLTFLKVYSWRQKAAVTRIIDKMKPQVNLFLGDHFLRDPQRENDLEPTLIWKPLLVRWRQ